MPSSANTITGPMVTGKRLHSSTRTTVDATKGHVRSPSSLVRTQKKPLLKPLIFLLMLRYSWGCYQILWPRLLTTWPLYNRCHAKPGVDPQLDATVVGLEPYTVPDKAMAHLAVTAPSPNLKIIALLVLDEEV
ncbi:hypothetical protein DVH24_002209 [Malus domestica]|uniref:Uncharacterized protein n=1 Tax=Malus domestica TaxID=3750 RepID=A0A498IAW1_MALDO|nr:hypothetical protein DVH24_002207 [Malus domestica]RXH78691.1 hypothetical protein DVH24_002209 [Malus domestica]